MSSRITTITYGVPGDMRVIPHAGMVSLEDVASDELDQREAEQPAPLPLSPDVDEQLVPLVPVEAEPMPPLPPDDDEVMTNTLPMIHTSTERIDQLEEEIKRVHDLVRVCFRRVTEVRIGLDDLKPVVAAVEATVTRWTGGQ